MNALIKRYGKEPRWVAWKLETRNSKQTKLPYQLNGRLASSTDAKTWATHAAITAKHKSVGIVLHDRLLLAIDLDHILEDGEIVHPKKEAIEKLIDQANSYTEISPSGSGLHIFIELTDPLFLVSNKKAPAEAYTSGRYITVTGNIFGKPRALRVMTAEEAYRLVGILIPQDSLFKDSDAVPSILDQTTIEPSDILEKMFASATTQKLKKLYDGDTSAYDDDASRADMALLSHLAFWTGRNAATMEALWLASPLAKRAKTQQRKDYRDRSIASAIKNCKDIYEAPQMSEDEIRIGDKRLALLYSIKDKSKIYFSNTENMARIIQGHPEFAGTFRYDEYRAVYERKVNGIWRNRLDHDDLELQTRISVLYPQFANIKKGMVEDAVTKVSMDNRIDSGGDYLRSLVWDGEARLDDWLHYTCHTPKDIYHRAIGSNWLKGLAKRILEPGCKFDYVLVLEGEQGIGKSTLLAHLAGPQLGHVETSTSTETKDFFMQFLGNAVIEFSEGETLSRTEVKRMKSIITVQDDKFRVPFGKAVTSHPRRCVFSMTTNQSEYLKDETGNRRWLPVAATGIIDIPWMIENREQLLAEAAHRVVSLRETTYEFPEEEMRTQQSMRRIQDPNTDPVVTWYVRLSNTARAEGITVDQAFIGALNGGFSGPRNRNVEMGISDILKNVLKLDRQRGMIGGVQATRWYPTQKTDPILNAPELQPKDFIV